jgi:protein arginine kinase
LSKRGNNEPEGFRLGEWLQGTGPDSDIAVCTRVRLARNVQEYRFSPKLEQRESEDLNSFLVRQFEGLRLDEKLSVLDVNSLDELERQLLMERHLISRDHASARRPRSVAINETESVAVMINEEDHIRAQVFQSGFQLQAAFARAERLDEAIMQNVPLAFSEEFGFLTSCPTNAGTGLRVSVMLHLPGLVWANEIEKATNTAQKIHLAVRGLYGEGSRALGDFYQVSNQVTLGRSEQQILDDVGTAVARLVSWEREVRQALLQGEPEIRTLDRIYRSLGVLERARILTSEEALNCLSAVRFGVQQGQLERLELPPLNRALLLCQPAHLQRVTQQRLSPDERDRHRAELLRRVLGRD